MWILYLILSLACFGVCCFFIAIKEERRYRTEKDNRSTAGLLGSGIGWLCFTGLFIWSTWPWWHWLFFDVFYMNITFWIGAALIAVLSLLILLKTRRTWSCVGAGVGALMILLIVLCVLGSPITKVKLYQGISPAVQELTNLPDTTQVRFLPLEIAHRYAENKLQESEVKIGDIDPIFFEDEFSWVAARIPNGFWRQCSAQSDGFALVRSDGSVEMLRQPMTYGESMLMTDNIIWKLRQKKYWVDIPEIYYLLDGEKIFGIAPYISFHYQFPVRVPYWGGVLTFQSDGTIQDLTPLEAQALSYTQGQPLFPEKLARQYVAAWAYKNGTGNAWFTHKDQVAIPEIENTKNQMPFLLPTAQGPEWMVATTPYGGRGIFKIFFINANNGAVQLYEPPEEPAWIGPNSIYDYIKTAIPSYNWYRAGKEESTGNILAIEPRPIHKEGKLYWMASITNTQYGGVSETVLVNSQNPNQILSFKNEGELKAFLTTASQPPDETTELQQQIQKLIEQLKILKQQLEELQQALEQS